MSASVGRLKILGLVFIFGLLAACGPGNTINLLPPPPIPASTIPAPNAPSVTVVNFADDRLDPATLGVRRDGSAFATKDNVSLWISRALADELARNGLRVTFANSTAQARSGNPDYLVTGQVNEARLKESSATEISSQIRVSCELANRKGKLWSESCNSSQSRSHLPGAASADNLFQDTMRDLVKTVAGKIIATIEKTK
ncbi:MAG: hypothetical protein K2H64_12485 [Desulfovibrio sp.]|nr:hypothetical protein [Desulfovibrio sp.]